jgi:DNA mismatch endonuclease, patch repair protein
MQRACEMPRKQRVIYDNLTSTQRSACMASIRSTDTRPEMVVRRLVHSLGYRYRLHRRELPGTPDLVLARYQCVILVHGCFWDMHRCKRGKSTPRSNVAFWRTKRENNRIRDRHSISALRRAGWRVLVVWECQTGDQAKLTELVNAFIKAGRDLRAKTDRPDCMTYLRCPTRSPEIGGVNEDDRGGTVFTVRQPTKQMQPTR